VATLGAPQPLTAHRQERALPAAEPVEPLRGMSGAFLNCEDEHVTNTAFYGDAAGGIFGRLLDLLNRLDAARIHYGLAHRRPDSVMIEVSLPGWRWEVEFMADGSVDVERYRSVAGVENDPALVELIFADIAAD
jgi:hypothetical protein